MLCVLLTQTVNGQLRRRPSRVRPTTRQRVEEEVEQQENDEQSEYGEEDNTPEPALQYYESQPQDGQNRVVLVSSDDDYNGFYGRPTQPPRSRSDYNRPIAKSTTIAPRTKETGTKEPPVQTIRNYSKVNDDGSFTFGYEAADGSFKEETRGTDCVVRGKYGYVDPDGNKREFTYVSGNPCDPNNPDQNEEERERDEDEDSNEPENVPLNFPRRPLARPPSARPPIQTTTHAPTTVFQNQYASNAYASQEDVDTEQEQPEPIQLLQPQRPRVSARPQHIPVPNEVAIRQRPKITINTTPTPLYQYQTTAGNSVSITPRPTYRIPITQPPATTYRPSVQFFTQKTPAAVTYQKTTSNLGVEPITKTSYASTRKPIDFTAELQKFQHDNNVVTSSTTPRISSNLKTFRPHTANVQKHEEPNVSQGPIYETQLVFDPASGQYDASLFPQLQQLQNSPFQLAQRLQPTFVPQQGFHPSPQILTIEQLQQQQLQQQQQQHQHLQQHQQQQHLQQQQSSQTQQQRLIPQSPSAQRSPLQFPQFSQQIYHKDHENLQVLNSQQLYAQQQELQQQQLKQDRLEATKRLQQHQQPSASHQPQQSHRFNLGQQQLRPLQPQVQQPGFYYVQQQAAPLETYF